MDIPVAFALDVAPQQSDDARFGLSARSQSIIQSICAGCLIGYPITFGVAIQEGNAFKAAASLASILVALYCSQLNRHHSSLAPPV